MDMDPPSEAIIRNVDEPVSFDVELKVDSAKLYGLAFEFSYDSTKLQLNTTTFSSPWVGKCFALPGLPGGTVGYRCSLDGAAEWDVDGGTLATFNFTPISSSLAGNGPWETLINISSSSTETNSGAKGGVKVFMNNAGFGAPSDPSRDITDEDDGKVIIRGIAKFNGFVDLQGNYNDSGASINVYDLADRATSSNLALGVSNASGKFTTSYLGSNLLTVGENYWFQVDAQLFLPTTRIAPSAPTDWEDNKILANRPETSLSTIILLGGDATNNDIIEITDATCIGNDYGKTGGFTTCGGVDGTSDVNNDHVVDILDLVLMGGNFDAAVSPWTP